MPGGRIGINIRSGYPNITSGRKLRRGELLQTDIQIQLLDRDREGKNFDKRILK